MIAEKVPWSIVSKIEADKYDLTRTGENREIHGLKTGVLTVMNNGGIDRETPHRSPGNQIQTEPCGSVVFVILTVFMRRPALAVKTRYPVVILPPCGIARIENVSAWQSSNRVAYRHHRYPRRPGEDFRRHRFRQTRTRRRHYRRLPSRWDRLKTLYFLA